MDIEQRLHRLEAKEAIRELRYEYARTVDGHEWDDFVELFTDDAKIRFPQENAGQTPFEGRDEIIEFGKIMDEQLMFSAHMMHNPRIRINDDSARANWYVEVPEVTPEGPVLIQGQYDDEYTLTETGWKFSSMDIEYNYRVAPDEGWTLNSIEEWQ